MKFSPTAWAKLLYLRDLGSTEVGGFGITEPDDLLCVTDFALVQQQCTETFVAFDDVAVAEFFDDQIDAGRQPQQCGRIWIHTHPGHCPQPSSVDVDTFQRVFGKCDWAIMFIIARGGDTFAQLHWRQGGAVCIPMRVDIRFDVPFAGSDHESWSAEYTANVHDCSRQMHRVRQPRWSGHELDDPFFEHLFEPSA